MMIKKPIILNGHNYSMWDTLLYHRIKCCCKTGGVVTQAAIAQGHIKTVPKVPDLHTRSKAQP